MSGNLTPHLEPESGRQQGGEASARTNAIRLVVEELAAQHGESEPGCVICDAIALLRAAPSEAVTADAGSTIRNFRTVEPGVAWQPIETAPKDSKTVLVFVPGDRGGVFTSHWLRWPLDRLREGWHIGGGIARPTHWMKLPEAPALRADAPEAKS